MPVIHVQSPGLFTTVQDLGRYGFGPLGVSASGAADPIALRTGNLLVGNVESAPGLEMTLLGGTFLFPDGGLVALTGSDFGADLDRSPVPMWTACEVRPGQVLRMGPTRSGARTYLSVRGGIAVKLFLGSASTHVLSGLGGLDGRPLRKGDILHMGNAANVAMHQSIPHETIERLRPRKVLRATVAPQTDLFSADAVRVFYTNPYTVTEESNRMGLRLEGVALKTAHSGQMITEGVSIGAIQVPPGGQPIILFVEQQTTGGYPKIANVVSADLPSVGQLRPRDEIRFEFVTPTVALALIRDQERLLAELSSSVG
jgi:biotin-dependent carboxylase-like uncharacterized protein